MRLLLRLTRLLELGVFFMRLLLRFAARRLEAEELRFCGNVAAGWGAAADFGAAAGALGSGSGATRRTGVSARAARVGVSSAGADATFALGSLCSTGAARLADAVGGFEDRRATKPNPNPSKVPMAAQNSQR